MIYRFDELFKWNSGKPVELSNGEIPVYGSNGIIGYTDNAKYCNKIILGRVGAYCGSVEYCCGEFNATDNTLVTTCDTSKIIYQYAFYLLKLMGLNKYAGGSAQPLITQGLLRHLKCNIPDVLEQKRVADFLTTYDQAIENNNKRVAILKQMSESLYKEWFVRFRFPNHEDYEFENGIPKGWAVKRVGDVSRLVNGRAYLMPELQDAGKYRIVRVGNFSGKNEWFYSDMELEPEKYCDKGDLLYKWACSFGPEIWDEEKVIYHYHIWKVVPNEQVNKEYLYHFFNFSTPLWLGGTNGATMVHITKETMEKKKIIIPPQNIMIEFGQIVSDINHRIQLLKEQTNNLKEQRELLLPRLMSGKLQAK